MEEEISVVCECGVTIPEGNISYSNNENDIGDIYCVVEAYCKHCKYEWEPSTWGWLDSLGEAAEYLQDYIDNKA